MQPFYYRHLTMVPLPHTCGLLSMACFRFSVCLEPFDYA